MRLNDNERLSKVSVLVLLGNEAIPVFGPFAFRFGVFAESEEAST